MSTVYDDLFAARDALKEAVANRWKAFTDAEVRAILDEMTTDDGTVYGYTEGEEPEYTIWRELQAEVERREST